MVGARGYREPGSTGREPRLMQGRLLGCVGAMKKGWRFMRIQAGELGVVRGMMQCEAREDSSVTRMLRMAARAEVLLYGDFDCGSREPVLR